MEIIVRKVGEFIGEKAKETFGAKKDLIKLILAVIGCIVAAAAIAVIRSAISRQIRSRSASMGASARKRTGSPMNIVFSFGAM